MGEVGVIKVPTELPHKAAFIVVFTNDDDFEFEIRDGKMAVPQYELPEDFKRDFSNAIVVACDRARSFISQQTLKRAA